MYLDTKLVSRGKDSNWKRKSLEYGFRVSGLGIWVKGTAMHRLEGTVAMVGGRWASWVSGVCAAAEGESPIAQIQLLLSKELEAGDRGNDGDHLLTFCLNV